MSCVSRRNETLMVEENLRSIRVCLEYGKVASVNFCKIHAFQKALK
jgi:hypothetical protein